MLLVRGWTASQGNKTKEIGIEMREFWVTVGAMVLGYVMYLGLRSMFKK